ncbi:MAG TPA: ABC transporter substrate-binding protein, partial [Candidatus Angelobacter sp.]|nr:ABC transporter substrate-binding protein [Candidatus Angelobacter sp.]
RLLRRHLSPWICVAGMFSPLLLPAQTQSVVKAGQLIYSKGESPAGSALSAVLGDTVVPAALMPCASCHGADGKGRTEGGIVPSDVTWNTLTRTRETDKALERRRKAYDLNSLRKVLREGVDPEGNELGITMPRYQISDGDMNSLLAYLEQLGIKNDPGVTATGIRVATVVPANGPLAESGANIVDLLRAYFAELNLQGGVYGRKIELEAIEARDSPAQPVEDIQTFIQHREVFGLVGLMVPGTESRLSDSLEQSGVPAIDVFAPDDDRLLAKPVIFHVMSGLAAQSRALAKFAQERMDPGASLVLLYPDGKQVLATTVMDACSTQTCKTAQQLRYSIFDAGEIVSTLAAYKPGGIIFLGQGQELKELLAEMARTNWQPQIFQPGTLAGEEAFRLSSEASEHTFFAFPSLPSDVSADALVEYGFLIRKYKLRPLHTARALGVLAGAKVFVEGLKLSGRDLSRQGFVDALATLYNFNTGLTPPLTYGVTRRVGALGAYMVKLDTKTKTFAPVASWIEAAR